MVVPLFCILFIKVVFLSHLLHDTSMVFIKEEAESVMRALFHNLQWILLHESHAPVTN